MKGILLLFSFILCGFTFVYAQSSKTGYPKNAKVDSILVLSAEKKVIEKTIFQYDSLNRERLKVEYALDDDGRAFTAKSTYETYYSAFGDAVITIQPVFGVDSLEKVETIQAGAFKTIRIVSESPANIKNFVAKTKSETFYTSTDTLATRTINYVWLNNKWERISIVEYSYLNKNLITEIESSIVDGAWVMIAKTDYIYDANNKEINKASFEYDYQLKTLIPSAKSETAYDVMQRPVFNAEWYWENASKKWLSLAHIVIDYLADNEEIHTNYSYVKENLKKDNSTKYTFDVNKNLLWAEAYGFDDKGNWGLRSKLVYYYKKLEK